MEEDKKPDEAQEAPVTAKGFFTVKSSVHMPTRTGAVCVTSPGKECVLSLQTARELAQNLLEVAAAAEVDAWLVGFSTDVIEMGWNDTLELVASFRRYRRGEVDPIEPLSAEVPPIDLVH